MQENPILNKGKIFLKTLRSTFLGDTFFLFGMLFLDSDVFCELQKYSKRSNVQKSVFEVEGTKYQIIFFVSFREIDMKGTLKTTFFLFIPFW